MCIRDSFNTAVDALLHEGDRIAGVKCGDEIIKGDAYVMAFGSYSTAMLKGLVDIPVYPLKGYSLTIPIAQEDGAPVSTILDETYKIAITRFDQRIRVGEMCIRDREHDVKKREPGRFCLLTPDE